MPDARKDGSTNTAPTPDTVATSELVDAVRREMLAGRPYVPGNKGHAALDTLRTRMEQMEQERDEALADSAYQEALEKVAATTSRLHFENERLWAAVETARAMHEDGHPGGAAAADEWFDIMGNRLASLPPEETHEPA